MNDFNSFINWYLGERTRIARGLFNVVFFIAFIPVLFIKMNDGLELVTKKADTYKPLLDMAEQMMGGGREHNQPDAYDAYGNGDAYDIEKVLQKSQNTRDITRQLMRDLSMAGQGEPSAQSKNKPTSFGDILNLLIFIGLIPIVHMRLRDIGKWNTEMWVYTAFIYSGIVSDSLKSIFNISFPFVVTSVLGVVTFIMLTWLCIAKSKDIVRSGSVSDTFMPGDKPNDPY